MNVLVTSDTNVVIFSGEILGYKANGNIIFADLEYCPNGITVFEVTNVPSDLIPDKYCYTETGGFTGNPKYIGPVVIEESMSSDDMTKYLYYAALGVI